MINSITEFGKISSDEAENLFDKYLAVLQDERQQKCIQVFLLSSHLSGVVSQC